MTDTHWPRPGHLQDMDHAECLALLSSQRVGRIAFADDSGPDLLPVNYLMDGETVLIATTGYGAIARAATRARVAFEVDQIDDYTQSGWSIVIRGWAHRQSPFELPHDRPEPWAEGSRTYFLRIDADSMTGRRLLPS